MTDSSRAAQLLSAALTDHVAHVTSQSLRHPEPPQALYESTPTIDIAPPATANPRDRAAGQPEHRPVARRWQVWASAAVLAAAVVVATAIVQLVAPGNDNQPGQSAGATHSGSSNNPSSETSPAPTPRTIPFSIKPDSGYTIIGASVENPAAFTDAEGTAIVVGHGSVYDISDYTPVQHVSLRTDKARPVIVNDRPGFYGCLSLATAPSACDSRQLAWRYTAHAWALITPVAGSQDLAGMRALAGATDFTGRSAATSPIQLSHAPRGTKLISWRSTYNGAATLSQADRDLLTSKQWLFSAVYSEPDGSWLQLTAMPDSVAKDGGHADEVTVAGHHGYWRKGFLDIELGHDVNLTIVESNALHTPATPLTKATALRIAATVSETRHPTHSAQWFPLADALL